MKIPLALSTPKGPFIIYSRGWAGKSEGGSPKILGSLWGGGGGVIENMLIGV